MYLPTVKLVDWLLDLCRKVLTAGLVQRVDRLFVMAGGYGMYVLMGLVAMIFIVAAIRFNDLSLFIGGIAVVPVGIVLQYIAIKMLSSVDRLIASSRTEMASTGFLDIMSLLNVLAAIIAPLAGLGAAISLRLMEPIYAGIALGLFCAYGAALALNPQSVNVHVSGNASIGQEAIGLLTFIMKGLYKVTPIAFGVGIVVSALTTLGLFIDLLRTEAHYGYGFGVLLSTVAATAAPPILLPVIGYLLFLIFYLMVDLYRSILLIAQIAAQYRRTAAPPPAAGGSRPAPAAAAAATQIAPPPGPPTGPSTGSRGPYPPPGRR